VYAAHFAAGLAIKSCVPEAPAWALLTGAFLPDFVWIALANRGIEPANPQIFFDDWSHSLDDLDQLEGKQRGGICY